MASCHLGYEFHLRKLDAIEADRLRHVTEWWKPAETGIHRLESSDPGVILVCHMAEDRARFVAFVGRSRTNVQFLLVSLRLAVLDAGRTYEVSFRNPEHAPPQSRDPAALKTRPLRLSDRHLRCQGIILPLAWPNTAYVVEGQAV